ncbi:hypothetical protein ANTQUA_LOCUS2683 [Anthophora quadrimaculata]
MDHLKSIANRQRQPRNVPRKTEKQCYGRERAGGATRSVLKVHTRNREREEARGHESGSEWSTRTQLCRPAQTGCRQIEPRFEFRTTVAARKKKPKRDKKKKKRRRRRKDTKKQRLKEVDKKRSCAGEERQQEKEEKKEETEREKEEKKREHGN